MHSRWIWPIHAIHHSDPEVTSLTTLRVHVLEALFMRASCFVLLTWMGLPAAAIFDVVFGTYSNPNPCRERVGAEGVPENDVVRLLLFPFTAWATMIGQRVRRVSPTNVAPGLSRSWDSARGAATRHAHQSP